MNRTQGCVSYYRLNTPYTRSDAGLGNNLEKADISGPLDVGTAASSMEYPLPMVKTRT